MKPLFNRVIIVYLLIIFTLITLYGLYLIKCEVSETRTSGEGINNNPIEVEISISEKIGIILKTSIPGIVVFVFGAMGLLLSLIKVPVRQVVPQEREPGAFYNTLGFMQTKLSKHEERIPILMWWLIRNRGIAQRVD